jgi:hypothetical protein
MPNQDEMRKKLDEMLLQKAGLTKVAPGSYRNLTSLPIEDLKAQLVGQTQNNNTPVVQQDVRQQLAKQQVPVQQNVSQPPVVNNNEDLFLTRPELFSSDRIWQAARQSRGSDLSGEGFAAGYNQNYSGSGYQGDPSDAIGSSEQRAKIIEWYKGYLAQHPELVNTASPETKANQILADRLENHYGGSQYTEDQMKAASEMLATHLKTQAEQEKMDNALKMQELKNQGLVEAAGAKASGGGQLPFTQLDSLSKNVAAIKQADDLLSSIDENKGQFGVGIGFINANNPWNTTGRDLQASLEKVAYELWRQIDPRLSEQDAKRAAKQVGGLNDPVELVIARVNNLKEEAVRKLNENINSYAGYGYTIPQNITDFVNKIKTAQKNIEGASGIKRFELNGEFYEIPSDDSEAIQEILAAGGKQFE